MAGLADQRHLPLVGLDEPGAQREAEPGSLPDGLRRVERLEDPRLDLTTHPGAGIGHREHDVRAGRHVDVARRVVDVQFDVGRFDRQAPALGHCVAGIHHQVDDHLLELARIHSDPS